MAQDKINKVVMFFSETFMSEVVFFWEFHDNLSSYFVFYFGFRLMMLNSIINIIWKCLFEFFLTGLCHQFLVMVNAATLPELHDPVVNQINQAITNKLHVACETNIAAAIKSKQT